MVAGGRARRALATCGVLLVAGALLAACGAPAPSGGGPTTTTTTTTTTLPTPLAVAGTRVGGALSAFGPIKRVPVTAVPDGAVVPPVPAQGAPVPAPGSVETAFRQFGSGPDLLLVAGEHASMTWWDPQLLEDLAQHYTVTVFDLPGTGFSGPAPGATSVEAVADLTAGLAAALGLKAPIVLGWGLGGEIALSMTERHPGLVSRLVLVDTSAGGPSAVRPVASVAAELASATATRVELASLLFPPTLIASITGWLARVAELPPDDLVAAAIAEEAALQASAWSDPSIADGLSRLRVPSLVVLGSLDEVFPPVDSTALAAALHGSRQVVLPGAGYAGIFQDEPQFVAALERFTG